MSDQYVDKIVSLQNEIDRLTREAQPHRDAIDAIENRIWAIGDEIKDTRAAARAHRGAPGHEPTEAQLAAEAMALFGPDVIKHAEEQSDGWM